MAALETTKSAVGSAAVRLGIAEPAASAAASAAGGVSAAVAAQVVWTPVDVVSQRLMVQTAAAGPRTAAAPTRSAGSSAPTACAACTAASASPSSPTRPPAPRGGRPTPRRSASSGAPRPRPPRQPRVRGRRAGRQRRGGGGAAALVTMPLDTVKTRLQVMDGGGASLASEARAGAGGRVGRLLPRPGAEVGVHVALRGHHGHRLRVLEAALDQGHLTLIEAS